MINKNFKRIKSLSVVSMNGHLPSKLPRIVKNQKSKQMKKIQKIQLILMWNHHHTTKLGIILTQSSKRNGKQRYQMNTSTWKSW